MDSPFMQRVAEGVAASGVRVIRFEFPYMQRRRETGKGGAPDPPRVLMQSFRDAIEEVGGEQQARDRRKVDGRQDREHGRGRRRRCSVWYVSAIRFIRRASSRRREPIISKICGLRL